MLGYEELLNKVVQCVRKKISSYIKTHKCNNHKTKFLWYQGKRITNIALQTPSKSKGKLILKFVYWAEINLVKKKKDHCYHYY